MHRAVDGRARERDIKFTSLRPAGNATPVVCNHVQTSGHPLTMVVIVNARRDDILPFVCAIRRTNDKSPWILTWSRVSLRLDPRQHAHGVRKVLRILRMLGAGD